MARGQVITRPVSKGVFATALWRVGRLAALAQAGVSLGGARPKSLIEIDGEPWLVRFTEGVELDTE